MNSDDSKTTGSAVKDDVTSGQGFTRSTSYTPATSTWQAPTASREDMSVIGPTLVIKGELEAGEDLLIEGRVEGTITHTAEQLLIGQRGSLKADIRARNVVIEGEVEGDVYGSESVSIKETATVRGNIFTPKISISEGAHFKGGIDMDVESVKKH
jgi:cytoskeletal protein CcmA (bactofilin family)